MRKYILTIVLFGLGLSVLFYSYTRNNQTKYTETLFSNEAKLFDNFFTGFINNVDKNFNSIQTDFKSLDKIKDTIYAKNYFLNFMENNPQITSTILIQGLYKIGIRKDKKSLMYAIDSTKELDVVQWQRFEDKKLISNWQESFDQSTENIALLKEIKKRKNKIQWIFKVDNKKNEGAISSSFYTGYSYPSNKTNTIILFQFSNAKLLEHFSTKTKYNQVNLLIKPEQSKMINLSLKEKTIDSLQLTTLNHFEKFNKKESGTFNFNFNNEIYWNSFKKYPSKTGILYYLLTIPDKEIFLTQSNKNSKLLLWLSIFLIAGGLLSLLIKKRFFYVPNRIEIPPVKEILNGDEDRYLEFKSSARWDYRQEKTNSELEKVILKTLAAFGNTDGGTLLIGVDDDKNIIGLEKDFNTLKKSTNDYYEIHLRNLFHHAMGVKNVSKYVRMQFEDCQNNKIICKIKILPTNEPIYLKFKNKNGQSEEKFFVRSGNSSQEIKSIAEINDYINTRFKK